MPRRNKRPPPKNKATRPKIRVYKTTARHRCGWPYCNSQVGPMFWGCRKHIAALPLDLRGMIANAWGPPQSPHLRNTLQKFMWWYGNQQPSNFEPGVFLPPPKSPGTDPNLDS